MAGTSLEMSSTKLRAPESQRRDRTCVAAADRHDDARRVHLARVHDSDGGRCIEPLHADATQDQVPAVVERALEVSVRVDSPERRVVAATLHLANQQRRVAFAVLDEQHAKGPAHRTGRRRPGRTHAQPRFKRSPDDFHMIFHSRPCTLGVKRRSACFPWLRWLSAL